MTAGGDLAWRWPLTRHLDLRDRLLAAYADPARGYHDLTHLREVLERLEELGTATAASDAGGAGGDLALVLAAWFHDAVYDEGGELEERSAVLAETELTGAGLPVGTVAEVARLVRLTGTHRPADHDEPGRRLCDADLAILAASPERYAAYVAGVRRDYAHVPEPDFRAGRAAVLRDLIARPRLYSTAPARTRWEAPARVNLTQELADLEWSTR